MHVRFLFLGLLSLLTWELQAAEPVISIAAGQPYGVATIEIPVAVPINGPVPPLQVTDENHRVVFPIANDIRVKLAPPSELPVPRPGRGRLLGRVGQLIRELTDGAPDVEQTLARRVTFLFSGDQPLEVRLLESGLEIGRYQIVPRPNELLRTRMLADWWTAYTAAAKRQIDAADYPPWVENYLVAMLSGRLGLKLPDWYIDSEEDEDQLLGTLKLLVGTQSIGEAVFRRAAAGDLTALAKSDRPLPDPPTWKQGTYPAIAEDSAVEPLASRVPPECFYIRYGSFQNFIWFRDLMDEYGGDLSRMITLRGVNDQSSQRLESQLNLAFTELSRLLGPTIIADQALIGRDLFFSEGGTFGVIMQSKNAFLLRTSLNADRSQRADSDPDVTLADVKIGGRTVSLLSSPDNRVRSFMAEDGEYFLFTNSEYLVRRFHEVGESGQSLASSDAFRLSRQLMPLDRNDTIFAYFLPQMLQGLVSPQYMIEMRRRLHATSDIALVHLARIACAAHGKNVQGIDDLVDAGFLPSGFGRRSDGSGTVAVGNSVIDTRRGVRGTFLPIADVEIDAVSQQEFDWYSSIATEYSERFAEIDPIMIGVQREAVGENNKIERLTVHAEIAPLTSEKYGWLAKQLGPPTKVAMNFPPDDIVKVQAHVASETIGPATHLFAGIRDTTPPDPEDFDGVLNIYRSLRQLPGYLGAWPRPGAIDRLPLGLGRGRPVGDGMTRLIGGIYRYSDDSFSVLSFQPEILVSTLPFLEAVDVEESANVRAHIGNLVDSELEDWVNRQLYNRAAESSQASANFLNLLTRQLQVEAEQATAAAKNILGGDLQCSLGGQFEYHKGDGWSSTAWPDNAARDQVPEDYVAPLLKWFRGAEARLAQYADRLIVDATVDVARK